MKKKLRMTEEQVKEETAGAVARAKSYCDDVEFSPEDGSRSDVDFLVEVCQLAVEQRRHHAEHPRHRRLRRARGVRRADPPRHRERRRRVRGVDALPQRPRPGGGQLAGRRRRRRAPGGVRDQRPRRAGGQRRARRDRDGDAHALRLLRRRCTPRCKTEELARTSRLVARLTGYPVQYNKAIIGRNAFAHEAGIHQHGVLEDRETYEIIDASTVGQEAAQIVLGKHSGRHAFADSLEKMGLHVQGDALNQAFTRFKELADRKVEITEADLEAIVAEELGHRHRAPVHHGEPRAARRHRRDAERARRALRRRRQGRSRRRGQRHDRRRLRGHRRRHRHREHRARLQGVVGDQGRRRARRRRRPARGPTG